ncbi:hypothetical protein Q4503_12000 [Colwellia sp. 6_MG-2023]|uniref:hypothetical protein n=1 Tax=Colwellia sp. 6_MG-2023 TaxID=3062676 RepID=UPI0026E39260|nr:hypothetical protein [Colwellia sp. 6_MG-2023]MDO6488429.1 hypothetical protein [Colwellia sp. 6_MG-2023]
MFNFIGKIFNTLQYQVDKNINESIYQNKVFLASKWNFTEKNILRWAQHYVMYTALLFVLAVFISTNLLLWKEVIVDSFGQYFKHWKELTKWQDTFLAVQLTIAAVVYPLIIGLVGVLFQNKSSKKTVLPIYQKYSGFMLAGFSGFALSLFIILGYFLRASVDQSTYTAICLTSAMWLSFNIILTGWFFAVTFLMLNESKRARLILRFGIHEFGEIDVKNRIKENLLGGAVKQGFLTSPDESIVKVSSFNFSDEEFNDISVKSDKELHVKNVSFLLLNLVFRVIVFKAKLRYRLANLLVIKWLKSRVIDWAHAQLESQKPIEFIVQPAWNTSEETHSLIRYSGDKLGWISKKIVRLSFSFKVSKPKDIDNLTAVMLSFIGEAQDALRDKDINAFKGAIGSIVEWHTEISSAFSFINDDGENDNWLKLPNHTFFSRTYLNEILSEYYRISKVAVELIPENIEFYNEVMHLYKLIFVKGKRLTKVESRSLIQGSYYTWPLLMEWRSYTSESSDPRMANKYEDVLYDFVGSWESWLDYIKSRSKRSSNPIDELPLLLLHLEYTAHTPVTALRFNNLEATGWGVDMLNNWIEKLSHRDHWHEEYSWKSEIITHNLLSKPADDATWLAILDGNAFKADAAFELAAVNAAFDIRIITACYFLLKPQSKDDEKIKSYIDALLKGTEIHSTGGADNNHKSLNSANDLLGAFIRHRDYGSGEGGYGAWLTQVLESFGRVNEKRRVSGRIYSGWGVNDPRSISKSYIEIAISLSKSKWQLGHKWIDIILSDAFTHVERDSIKSDLNDWMKISEEITESLIVPEDDFTNNLENFKSSIKLVIEQITQHQVEVITSAEVDHDLLTHFGQVCSKQLNNLHTTTNYPINLFQNIGTNTNCDSQHSFKVNIIDYLKERIAVDVKANRAINEDEWLESASNDNIKVNILRSLLGAEITQTKTFDSIKENISDLITLSKDINDPVLFIGDNYFRMDIRKARYNEGVANNFNIYFYDGYGPNYICHIGEIEVYSLRFSDINYSLLTSKKLFKSIEFSKIADKQFVEVSFKPNKDNESIGTLSLNYWMNITLAENQPCIKTILNIKDEE